MKHEGLEKIDLPFGIGSGRHDLAKDKFEMQFWKKKSDSSLFGYVTFGEPTQGPPGYVHGGMQAFVLDEMMGTSAWLKDMPCVASEIKLQFLEMVPIHKKLIASAWVKSVSNRSIETIGEIKFNDQVLVRSTGTFFWLSRDRIKIFFEKTKQNPTLLERFVFPDET